MDGMSHWVLEATEEIRSSISIHTDNIQTEQYPPTSTTPVTTLGIPLHEVHTDVWLSSPEASGVAISNEETGSPVELGEKMYGTVEN